MGKVIFWLLLVFGVMFVLRLISVAKLRQRRDDARPAPPGETRAVMVKCVECGVYLPQAEAKTGPRGPCCGDDACHERARRAS